MVGSSRKRPSALALAVALLLIVSIASGAEVLPSRAVGGPGLAGGPARPGGPVGVDRVVAALAEVQGGSLDGLDYLSIGIEGAAVGPLRCRGRLLRADASAGMTSERRAAMEHVALAALFNAESVLVTVPLAPQACLDGQPTFTRLDPLPASP